MPIALPDFVAGVSGDSEVARSVTAVITANLKRSGLFVPIDPAAFIETHHRISTCRAFADWRTINAQALVTGRMTRQSDGRLKAEFRLWDVFAGQQLTGQQYFTDAGQLAAHRAYHLGCDLSAAHRREGLLRHPHRVRRRVRSEGPPRQAARDHGSGRRQRALPHARRRSRAHAALLAVDAGNHLHVVRQGDPRVFLLNIETGQREVVGNFPA
jgi:TolB protein